MEFPIILSIILLTGCGLISNVSGGKPLNKFQVKEGNVTCILAQFSAEATFPNGESFIFKDGTSQGSLCGSTQQLRASFSGIGQPRLDFVFQQRENRTELYDITLFMNGTLYNTNVTEPYFSVLKGNSWKCDFGFDVILMDEPPVNKVRLVLESVKFDVYRESDNDKYENELQCKGDSVSNKTVPMIIAFVLAGMVIIMLVGYVILRRKEDKTTYQSV